MNLFLAIVGFLFGIRAAFDKPPVDPSRLVTLVPQALTPKYVYIGEKPFKRVKGSKDHC